MKKLNATLFLFGVLIFSTIARGQNPINRSPSVDPVVEIDIEDVKKVNSNDPGYNFETTPKKSAASAENKKRVPANIVNNTQATPVNNYIGPILFLITLPFALWLMISKKMTAGSTDKSVDYYPKNHQFKPSKTEYQQPEEDDDDSDYPKAS